MEYSVIRATFFLIAATFFSANLLHANDSNMGTIAMNKANIYASKDAPKLLDANLAQNDDFFKTNYRCSFGGEPLVVISAYPSDFGIISASKVLRPIYVRHGYRAKPLFISMLARDINSSHDSLFVKTLMPSHVNEYIGERHIKMSLEREDKQPFYVHTVLFASLEPQDGNEKFYTNTRIYNGTHHYDDEDGLVAYNSTPIPMYSYDESLGIFVYNTLSQITAYRTTWNAIYPSGKVHSVPYRYRSKLLKESDITYYIGYGFWICGSDASPTSVAYKSSSNAYYKERESSK